MDFHVLTLFPEMIEAVFNESITGRAQRNGIVSLNAVNIRDFSKDPHKKTDDYTYGGGAGMLMFPQPIYDAYLSLNVPEGTRVIYVTPVGRTFNEDMVKELSKEKELVFLCGHYEGVDERVLEKTVTDRISIGDYVLTGGELPALVIMDAITRLLPGALGNEVSFETESFYDGLLEYPQYSRPSEWEGMKVPDVLLSGDHKKVDEWRLSEALRITKEIRPDMYEKWASLHPEYFEAVRKRELKKTAKERKKALKALANPDEV